jgi:REP element-mobilizing transposase RayT
LGKEVSKNKIKKLSHRVNSAPGEYFITICTHDHGCIFGEVVNEEMRLSQEGEIVQGGFEEIPKYYPNIELDSYVIMPNNIHGIIVITEPVGAIHESPLQMTQYKRRKSSGDLK